MPLYNFVKARWDGNVLHPSIDHVSDGKVMYRKIAVRKRYLKIMERRHKRIALDPDRVKWALGAMESPDDAHPARIAGSCTSDGHEYALLMSGDRHFRFVLQSRIDMAMTVLKGDVTLRCRHDQEVVCCIVNGACVGLLAMANQENPAFQPLLESAMARELFL